MIKCRKKKTYKVALKSSEKPESVKVSSRISNVDDSFILKSIERIWNDFVLDQGS
jgi:hypothetical protein